MHFRRRPQIKLLRLIPHPLFFTHLRLRLETNQTIVRFPILALDVMHVIRRHKWQLKFFGPLYELPVDLALSGNAVVLKFEIEIARRKNLPVLIQRRFGLVNPRIDELVWHFAFQTGG